MVFLEILESANYAGFCSASHICKPPKLHNEKFRKLFHISDPVPGTDCYYLPFTEIFETDRNESHHGHFTKSARIPFFLLPVSNTLANS